MSTGEQTAEALRARLARWLAEHDKSARWLSLRAGVSENVVGRYVEGATKQLRPENWARLAPILGWDADRLLAEVGWHEPPPPPTDTAGQIERLLRQAGVSEAGVQAILWSVRQALELAARPTSDVPR